MADLNAVETVETVEAPETENNNDTMTENVTVEEDREAVVTPVEEAARGNRFVNAVKRFARSWFPVDREVRSKEARVKMPLPIMACLATIAVSLTLIVGSSAMISGAHRDVANLQTKVDTLAAQAGELTRDLNDRIDLLEIRNIAVNEYGMISEEFISMRFLNVRDNNTVESYRAGSEPSAELGDVLSAD